MTLIRSSGPEDAERLFLIWAAAVDATHDFLSPADRMEIARVVRHDYLPAATLRVAVDGADRPLGFMGMTGAHIDALFVDPAAHGRGVGRALVERALVERALVEQALVEQAGASAARLTVDVNEQNGGACAFYHRLGFRQTGRSARDDGRRPYPLLHLALV